MAWIPIGNNRDISVGKPPNFVMIQPQLSKARTTYKLLLTTFVVGAFLASEYKTVAMISDLLRTLIMSNVAL